MIPEHYLYIILGAIAGVPIGFFVASILACRKFRRLSAEEWMAAKKYYTWANQQKID